MRWVGCPLFTSGRKGRVGHGAPVGAAFPPGAPGRRRLLGTVGVLILAATAAACTDDPGGGDDGDGPAPAPVAVRLNEIQVLSTHNSYKIEPEPALLDALRGFVGDQADEFQYSHLPLQEQFDLGVRQIELDLMVDDPDGGRFADPVTVELLDLEPNDPTFAEPGLKVLHVQEVDYRSTCPLLTSCLEQVREWSEANPGHLPITIQIEPKDDEIPDPGLGFVQPIAWSEDAFADLEEEILSVFSEDDLITPAEVQGDHPTLREAVGSGEGWPTLSEARGRVMFTLDHTGAKRDLYRGLRPDPVDRVLFVDARPPEDDAAIAVVNDPVGGADEIRDLIAAGLIVRTRADANTHEARSGDTTRADAAWAGGAHFVTTDYIVPDERLGTGYVVAVPGGGPARCNPVVAADDCDDEALTEPLPE